MKNHLVLDDCTRPRPRAVAVPLPTVLKARRGFYEDVRLARKTLSPTDVTLTVTSRRLYRRLRRAYLSQTPINRHLARQQHRQHQQRKEQEAS